MIKTIIELLSVDEYYGISKDVDIAKGLYSKPKTLSETLGLIKRLYHGWEY